MVVKYRIGSDLDGDGFINWGIASDTPPNLYPGALYTAKSLVRGLKYTTASDTYTDLTDISDQGFITRSIQLGKTVSEDYAESIRLGFTTYRAYQRRAGDPENLFTNSIYWSSSGVSLYGSIGNAVQTARRALVLNASNGLSGFNAVVIGQQLSFGYNAVGYYDVGLQYSKSVNAAAVLNGISVVAGQTYTLSLQAQVATGRDFNLRIYGNNGVAGSPTYGRQWIASHNYTSIVGTAWTEVTITFTVPVGVTKITVDIQSPSNSFVVGLAISGFMLFDGTVTAPTRLWDTSIYYLESQFNLVLEAGKDYIYSFWAKSDDGIDGLVGSMLLAKLDEGFATNTNADIAITNEWQRYDFTITSESFARGIGFDWTATKGGVATGLGNVGSVQFKGFMLTEGTEIWPYHVGTNYAFDDLTPYALNTSTKSGKGSFHESLAYEGTMTVALKNDEKLFSPANTSSPFYGVLDQNRKTILQVWDGTEWRNLWSGWSTAIDLSVGENSDNRATLTCQQGLFRLREGTFSAPLTQDTAMDQIVRQLIESSGWRSTVVPFQSTIGFDARVDENFYVLDTDSMFGTVQEGVNDLEFVGQDWGRKGDIEAALKELLASENASFWINRDGRIVVVNRNYWVNRVDPIAINIDSDAQNGEYIYGQNIVNRVETMINRKRAQTDQLVWKTHRAFLVKPFKLPSDTIEVEIHAERVEGRTKTVISYTLDGMTKNVYTADPGVSYTNTQDATSDQSDKVTVELVPVGSGNLYRLRITNRNTVNVWVDVELKGDYLDTEDGTLVVVEDADAINRQEAIHSQKLTTNVLNDPEQARSLGMFYILRDATPAGEFVSIEMNDVAQEVDVDKLFDLQLGTKIAITESQTCETNNVHWIIGEDFTIGSNVITVKYTTARTIPGNFLAVDDNLTTPYTNAVVDWTNVRAVGHNTATYDGEKIIFDSWTPTPLYLDPGEGQIKTYILGKIGVAYVEARSKFIVPSTNTDSFIGAGNAVVAYLDPLDFGARYRFHGYGGYNFQWLYSIVDNDLGGLAQISTPGTVTSTYGTASNTTDGRYCVTEANIPSQYIEATNREKRYENNFQAFLLLQAVSPALPAFQSSHSGPITQVKMRKVTATTIDSSVSHKYTLFARKDASQPDESKFVKLTVYSGATGATIGSDTKIITNAIQKWEVSIPSGHSSVWATFEQTPFIGWTRQWASSVGYLVSANCTIYIYGYGVTASSVTTYADLQQPQNYPIIYP